MGWMTNANPPPGRFTPGKDTVPIVTYRSVNLLSRHTDPEAHPSSCTMDTGSFPGLEAAEAWG